jgi:hypothetical protein
VPTPEIKNRAPATDATCEQATERKEPLPATAGNAGNLYHECEKAVDRAIELELKIAELTHQEWLKNLTGAQADFARELSTSYATAMRALPK